MSKAKQQYVWELEDFPRLGTLVANTKSEARALFKEKFADHRLPFGKRILCLGPSLVVSGNNVTVEVSNTTP